MFSTLKSRLLRRRNRPPPSPTSSAGAVAGSRSHAAFASTTYNANASNPNTPNTNNDNNKAGGRFTRRRSSEHRARRRRPDRNMPGVVEVMNGIEGSDGGGNVNGGGGGGGMEGASQEFSMASTHVSRDPFMNDAISVVASEVGGREGMFGGKGEGGLEDGEEGGEDALERRRRGRDLRERVAIDGVVECAAEEERGLLEIVRTIGMQESLGKNGELLVDAVKREVDAVKVAREDVLKAAGVVDVICGRVVWGRMGEFGDLLALRMTKMDGEREEQHREHLDSEEQVFFGELKWKERLWDLEEAMGEGRFADADSMVSQLTVDDIKSRVSGDLYAEFKNLVRKLAVNIHKYCAVEVAKAHLYTLAHLGFHEDVRSALLISAHDLLINELANISAVCRAPPTSVSTARFASIVVTKLFRRLCLTRTLYSRLISKRSRSMRSSSKKDEEDRTPELFIWVIEQIETVYEMHLQKCVTTSTDLQNAAEITRAMCDAIEKINDEELEQMRMLFSTRIIQLVTKDIAKLLKNQKTSLAKIAIPKILVRDPLTSTHSLTQSEMQSLTVSQGSYGITERDLSRAVGSSQASVSGIEVCRLLVEFARRILFPLRGLSTELDKELEGVIAWGIGVYTRLIDKKAGRELQRARVAMQNVLFVGGTWGGAWGGEIRRVGRLVGEGTGIDKWWQEVEEGRGGDKGRPMGDTVNERDDVWESEVESMIGNVIGTIAVAGG